MRLPPPFSEGGRGGGGRGVETVINLDNNLEHLLIEVKGENTTSPYLIGVMYLPTILVITSKTKLDI